MSKINKKLCIILGIGIICININNLNYGAEIIDTTKKTSNPILQVFESKEDLFNKFFADFYDYIIDYKNGKEDLEKNEIYSLEDFYKIAKTYEEGDLKGMPQIGKIAGKFFARSDSIYNITNQTVDDGFVGYCISNNKYIPQLQFFIDFFKVFRTDEGLLETVVGAEDFLVCPNDTIIDICKFFYWNKDTIPDSLKIKGNLQEFWDNIPGIICN